MSFTNDDIPKFTNNFEVYFFATFSLSFQDI